MSHSIRCAIIEDEPLAQNVLKNYISEHPDLVLTAVFDNALDAQKQVSSENFDIIFLDINLPKLSGINFLKSLTRSPLVIFTTAYSNYAVEGFELDAIDYLVKPFSFERFLKAINKAIEKINAGKKNKGGSSFIFLRSDKKLYQVNIQDILLVEAIGDYVKVITENGQHVVNESLKNLLNELPSHQFIRVHKSFIIAKDKIKFFQGNFVKVGERDIPIGNSYREEIFARLKEKKL